MQQELSFEPVGHFIVFGETFSGKTYYTKHLFQNKTIEPKKIFVFTGSPHEWSDSPEYTVFTDDFDTNASKIVTDCLKELEEERKLPTYKPKCETIIVFDDFNEQINTKTNDIYKSLYTKGRQAGIRVINIAHQSHAIGPTARANARYICIMASTSDAELESLADLFFGKNHVYLKRKAEELRGINKYSVIVIDKTNRQLFTDVAKEKNRFMEMFEDVDVTVDLPQGAALATNPGSVGYHGVAAPTVSTFIGTKTATNMVDNSINNFNVNHNVKMQQLVEQNNVHNDIKMQNLKFDLKYQMISESQAVKDIIRKPFRTPEDKKRILADVNKRLRPNIPYTMNDFDEGVEQYMKIIHKEPINLKMVPVEDRIIDSAGDLVGSLTDPIMFFGSGAKFLSSAMGYSSGRVMDTRAQTDRIKALGYKK